MTPDPELRSAVAREMGFHKMADYLNGACHPDGTWVNRALPYREALFLIAPHFDTDLNAAETLIDKLAGWQFICVRHKESGTWSATFEIDEDEGHTVIDQPTQAIAICRAFLLVMKRDGRAG